jgi:hypothetical protein
MSQSKLPSRPQDRSQRLLFHHRRPIRDLVRGFVPEPWVQDLDFRTLKRLPSDYISGMMPGEYEERTGDILWQVRWRRGKAHSLDNLYVLVLVEHQSTCAQDMALRILTYIVLFYQRLRKGRPLKKGELLPPILPMILYNGDVPWWAPLNVFDLIHWVPESFAAHIPSMKCILIDEKRCRPEDLAALQKNVVAAIVRVEQTNGASALGRVVRDLEDWLSHPRDRELCRDLLAWLAKVVVPMRCPGAEVPELRSLHDLVHYVEADMPNWIEEAEERGEKRGRQEGQAEVILRLIEHKHGAVSEDVKERILSAGVDQLLLWTDRILTAESLGDIFLDEDNDGDTN